MSNDYLEPNVEFIMEYYSKMNFGMIKPSEFELFMFFVLAYHRGDLEKSTWELAKKYCITEQKASRFKLEIGRRFSKRATQDDMLQLARDIFETKKITLDWDDSKICIPVNDPCYLRSLKESLSIYNLPYDMGNNGNLVRLSTWVFLAVFAKSGYSGIKRNIKSTIKNQLAEKGEYDNLFNSGIPLSVNLKEFLKENAADILGLVPVVGDLLKLTFKARKKIINKG